MADYKPGLLYKAVSSVITLGLAGCTLFGNSPKSDLEKTVTNTPIPTVTNRPSNTPYPTNTTEPTATLQDDYIPTHESEQDTLMTYLTTYDNTRFTGGTITCDIEFIDELDRINQYATNRDVYIYITDSFRIAGQPVYGNIVPPSTTSNHLVGHAIDMNIIYDGILYNSKAMSNFSNLPSPVQDFLNDIRNDGELRWGGDFTPFDPVHIDDGYNLDMDAWNAKFLLLQEEAINN